MRRGILNIFAICLLLGSISFAAHAEDMTVTQTVDLKMDQPSVWALIEDFGGLQKWHIGITKCELISGENNQAGAVRIFFHLEGDMIQDQLVAYDPAIYSYTTDVLKSPLPVTKFMSTISVLPGKDGGSKVEWKGLVTPAPNADAAAVKFEVEEFFKAGLTGLLMKDIAK